MPELKSEYLFTFKTGVTALHDIGPAPAGGLHIDLLGSGTFEGPRLKGEVLGGGMDMKRLKGDGSMGPNVRLVLRTDDGALIFMHYTGVRHGAPEVMARIAAGEVVDPGEYYLRNTPYFETSAPKYDWLNRIVAVGVGRRMPDHAVYEIFQIL
jgi:hypothetical protein